MAEDLSEYLQNNGVRCKYMHYDIETIDRIELLRGLRAGEFDVLVGINLLREGLGHAGGVAGGHSRCGQRRLPPQ